MVTTQSMFIAHRLFYECQGREYLVSKGLVPFDYNLFINVDTTPKFFLLFLHYLRYYSRDYIRRLSFVVKLLNRRFDFRRPFP